MTAHKSPAAFVPLTQAIFSFSLFPERRQEFAAVWLGIVGKDPVRVVVGLGSASGDSLPREWSGAFVVDLLTEATPWAAGSGRRRQARQGERPAPTCQLQLICSGGTVVREAGSLQVSGELREVVREGRSCSELSDDDPCLAVARGLGLFGDREGGVRDSL